MRPWPLAFVPACALLVLEACEAGRDPPARARDAAVSAARDEPRDASPAPSEAPRLVLPLAAANFVASVSDSTAWPESDAGAKRLGYLRNGAVVPAYDPPIRNDECKDGWYELVGGGYVCGKVATIDLTNPRVRLAPKQPDRDAGMPYRYASNVVDGTPVYRRVLKAEDRRKYEHRPPAPKEVPSAEAQEPDQGEEGEAAALGSAEDEAALAGSSSPPPGRKARAPGQNEPKASQRSKDPFRDPDAGRPRLKDLKGRGVLVRQMARGFTVAVDRDFKAAGARWWRTTFGFAIPYERLYPLAPRTKLVGSWFPRDGAGVDLLPLPGVSDADGGVEPELSDALADGGVEPELSDASAPDASAGSLAGTVAFVTRSGTHALELTEDAKGAPKVGWGPALPKRTSVLLTGRDVKVGGVTYHQTSTGFWVRLPELRMAKPEIPDDVGVDEKWIDVDLTRQQLVAFEGRRPVFATLISSGRRNPQDPTRDFATPPGTFWIREKHVTATMDGDVASDGPYSIEDVPWVMYYQGSYALHGAFWHDAFGHVRSHGCVNMSPDDAKALFDWADPPLPPGWHGVFSQDETSGSRVVVHEDPRPGKRRR